MREDAGESLVWLFLKPRHSTSNNALLEYDQFSEFARPAVNVYQKSRLRFILQKTAFAAMFLVHILDASSKLEDADLLHFGTISVPGHAQSRTASF